MANLNTKIKAYVDGFYYVDNEEKCSKCGANTNRINVQTEERQCCNCDDVAQ